VNLHENVLPKEELEKYVKDLNELKGKPVWNNSQHIWPTAIRRSIVGTVNTTPLKIAEPPLNKYFEEYEAKRIVYQYCIWGRMSGISSHFDTKYAFAATLYLNEKWDKDWGGILVWDNKEWWDKCLVALCPKQNSMVVNDGSKEHMVTLISPCAKEDRLTMQIWGFAH